MLENVSRMNYRNSATLSRLDVEISDQSLGYCPVVLSC